MIVLETHCLPWMEPADRFIAATALGLDATLLTADDKLLVWQSGLRRPDARI